jgi:flagellar hook protein FlgE
MPTDRRIPPTISFRRLFMSITSAMYTGISGLSANGNAINVIGNNIANANTSGFKSARVLFSDLLYQSIGNNSQVGSGTQIQKVDNVMSQASFASTTSVTDLAIDGVGFFEVQNSAGGKFYTRAGAFRVDEAGKYLVNPDGYRLDDAAGAAIDVSGLANFAKITSVDSDGTITWMNSAGATAQYGTKIGIATFKNPAGLENVGGTLYRAGTTANAGGRGSGTVALAAPDANNKTRSNSLELSNVDMANEFVSLITTQRAFSANSKTITTADEMTQEVLSLKR